jgi:hypothetical protein
VVPYTPFSQKSYNSLELYGLLPASDFQQSWTIRFIASLRLSTVLNYTVYCQPPTFNSLELYGLLPASDFQQSWTIRFIASLRIRYFRDFPDTEYLRESRSYAVSPPAYTLIIGWSIDVFVFIFCFCSIFAAKSTEFCRYFFIFLWARIKTRPWIMYTGDWRVTANLCRYWPYTVKFEVRQRSLKYIILCWRSHYTMTSSQYSDVSLRAQML